jgi:hypothetical protein
VMRTFLADLRGAWVAAAPDSQPVNGPSLSLILGF